MVLPGAKNIVEAKNQADIVSGQKVGKLVKGRRDGKSQTLKMEFEVRPLDLLPERLCFLEVIQPMVPQRLPCSRESLVRTRARTVSSPVATDS